MQPIDPKDHTNAEETKSLLEKSKELKERAKITSETLDKIKERADKFKIEHPDHTINK